jgi:hypothetical protein
MKDLGALADIITIDARLPQVAALIVTLFVSDSHFRELIDAPAGLSEVTVLIPSGDLLLWPRGGAPGTVPSDAVHGCGLVNTCSRNR